MVPKVSRQVVSGDRHFDAATVSIGQAVEAQADRSGCFPADAPHLSPEQLCHDMVCLDKDDPELQRAWSTFPDPVMEHHGEAWQYMGTRHRDQRWQHAFRHRCHPLTNARTSVEIAAAPGWERFAR